MSKNVVIAGGSGLVGSHLSKRLIDLKYKVQILTRGESKVVSNYKEFVHWNPAEKSLPTQVLTEANVVINLVGRNIGDKRLSGAFKEEVYKSRIETTKLLVTFLNSSDNNCNLYIGASAIGYYGYNRGEEVLEEDADPGLGFMADLCRDWEIESQKLENIRTVIPRIGVVLDKEKGAYPSLKQPVLLSLGSALASGKQWMSWIHINDLTSALIFSIQNTKVEGVMNAVSPSPVRNRRMVGAIADSLNKVIFLPRVPAFVLRMILGEFAEAVIGGVKVMPNKLQESGFEFQYTSIDRTVDNLNWGK